MTTTTRIDLPVDLRRATWLSPKGEHGSFVPNGKPKMPKSSRLLTPNWRSSETTWSARLFVGFNVGTKPTYDMEDLIKIVRRVLKEQGKAPDSSFLYQRGIYSHAGPGSPVVEENGAQVVILNLSGETPRQFEKRMVELANIILTEMQQEMVIVQMQEDGVIRETIGVTETESELDVYDGSEVELTENKRETFKDAKERLLNEFADLGWVVHRRGPGAQQLKVPYVIKEPRGRNLRLWFKPQAAYVSEGITRLGDARSLVDDYRGYSAKQLETIAESYVRNHGAEGRTPYRRV